jgi:outer membrane receptor protein involved in Fe transport
MKLIRVFAVIFMSYFASIIIAQAQPPGGMNTQSAGKNSMAGKVIGRVLDAETKKPVVYASVVVLTLKNDSLITGCLTDEKGYFAMKSIPFNTYKIKITFVGYNSFEKIVSLNVGNTIFEVGDCLLNGSAVLLNSVTVSSEKQFIEFKPDKKVINVAKDLSAKGGTALDALKNAPGITVNSDDEVVLRNNSPTIYVDGKPTQLTMRQIPAEGINTIEIITNPSAKYEAAATGGIINITLKKNRKPGYNGMFNLGLGTNNQITGMGMLSVKESKWGASITGNLNSASNTATGYTYRNYMNNGIYNGGNYQDNTSTFNRQFKLLKTDFDYFIDNRNTISFSGVVVAGKFSIDETQNNIEFNQQKAVLLTSNRINLQDIHFSNYATGLSFLHTYPKQGKEYTADLKYSFNNGENEYDYRTKSYDVAGDMMQNNPEIQLIDAASNAIVLTAQFDFTNPIDSKNKLEYGLRANWSASNSNQYVNNYSYTLSLFQYDSLLSNNYQIDEIVAAGYLIYSGSNNKLTYQGGLRMESSNYYAEYNDTSRYNYNYPDSFKNFGYALFPSLYFSYKLNSNHQLQFNISRKIVRPNMFQAAPFVFASDKYNYRTGNPLLKPEFVILVELNHNYSHDGINILNSIYAKYNQQPITTYAYFADTSNQLLITTFTNADYGYSYGFEPNISFSRIKNINIIIDANFFYSYTGVIEGKTTSNSGWSWNTKATISYTLPKQFVLQLNGAYEAPRFIPQGTILAMYGMDASVSKAIGDLTLIFTVNDVFNTRTMEMEYDTPQYNQVQSRRRDVRYARISLSYRFGKMEASLFKMKKNRDDMPNMNSGDGY